MNTKLQSRYYPNKIDTTLSPNFCMALTNLWSTKACVSILQTCIRPSQSRAMTLTECLGIHAEKWCFTVRQSSWIGVINITTKVGGILVCKAVKASLQSFFYLSIVNCYLCLYSCYICPLFLGMAKQCLTENNWLTKMPMWVVHGYTSADCPLGCKLSRNPGQTGKTRDTREQLWSRHGDKNIEELVFKILKGPCEKDSNILSDILCKTG